MVPGPKCLAWGHTDTLTEHRVETESYWRINYSISLPVWSPWQTLKAYLLEGVSAKGHMIQATKTKFVGESVQRDEVTSGGHTAGESPDSSITILYFV